MTETASTTWEKAGVKIDLGSSLSAAYEAIDGLSYTDARRVYAELTGDKVPRHPDPIKAYLRARVTGDHALANGGELPEEHADKLVGLEEEARRSVAPKVVQGRKGSIDHVLQACAEEGVTDPAQVLARVDAFLEGAPPAYLTIKEVTIRSVLALKSTPEVLKDIEVTFRDVPGVAPSSTDKTVAFYRTRLRTDYSVDLPRAAGGTRAAATAPVEVTPEDLEAATVAIEGMRDAPAAAVAEEEAPASEPVAEEAAAAAGDEQPGTAPSAEGLDETEAEDVAAKAARRPRRSSPDLGVESHVRGAGRARDAAKKSKTQGGRGPK